MLSYFLRRILFLIITVLAVLGILFSFTAQWFAAKASVGIMSINAAMINNLCFIYSFVYKMMICNIIFMM